MKAPSGSERGIALVVVLWVLALLAVLVLGFASDTRTELQIARNQDATAHARAIADAGVTLAVLGVLDPSPTTRWQADGRLYTRHYGGGTIRISVQDEGGKIDLNQAQPAILGGLFRVVGVAGDQADQLVDAVLAWRDAHRPGSATDIGTDADRFRPSPQRAFLAVDELRLLPGMTREIYDRVEPFVTVYSGSAQVNPMTAPAEVLESLPGIDPGAVAGFVAARAGDAATPGSVPALPGAANTAAGPVQVFTVTSEGTTAAGARFTRQAVAQAINTPVVPVLFLSWRQAPRPLPASLPRS